MGLLAPLYIAGLLAIALPVAFHLIRRAPAGRQAFSSLMFLSPSPPRLTRRSRLTHLLLLLLRAAALALLALAFARPFLASADGSAAPTARGRRVAVLVDTSASMRRGDLWQQAVAQAERALGDLRPEDEAALYFFDRSVRPGMTFAEWNELPPPARPAAVRARLAAAGPTWAGTRLGDALAAAADLLTDEDARPAVTGPGSTSGGGPATGPTQRPVDRAGRQLVLVSDLQQGGHAEALQGHPWPEGVLLQVRAVTSRQPTNATLRLAEVPDASSAAAPSPKAEPPPAGAGNGTADGRPRVRVRVANQPGAAREQFTLTWADDRGPLAGVEPLKLYVPPGRTQVAAVPLPEGGDRPAGPGTDPSTAPAASRPTPAGGGGGAAARSPDRLVLAGDDADFDNTLFVVPRTRDEVRVLYLGDDAAGDVKGLLYYLQGGIADTPQRRVEVVVRRAEDRVADTDWAGVRLAVIANALPADQIPAARAYVEAGGDLLWVLPDLSTGGGGGVTAVALAKGLDAVTGMSGVTLSEVEGSDYALIGRVDLDHPLFSPFANARYADFTKIHFWHRRRLAWPGGPDPAVRVLARFDDGDPFLLERAVGRGRAWVMTSGWRPADSQLALSTKFVPLLDGLVRPRDAAAADAQQGVYEPIRLPSPPAAGSPAAASPAAASPTPRSLLTPDGRKIDLPAGATAVPAELVDRPGVYRVLAGDRQTPIAVNLAPDEGRTAPLAVEELERFGAKLGTVPTSEELVARQRQLRTAELENRQKLWRWVVLVVLGLLAAETVMAGVLARRER